MVEARRASFLCELELTPNSTVGTTSPQLTTPTKPYPDEDRRFIQCPQGHFTHSFMACDVQTVCWKQDMAAVASCTAPVRPLPPSFQCSRSLEFVPYSLLCNFWPDCNDVSDEDFCVFPRCAGAVMFDCGNGQCFTKEKRCDRVYNCKNKADEQDCEYLCSIPVNNVNISVLPPAAVHFDGKGNVTLESLQKGDWLNHTCPETHFACSGVNYYCMPVYVRCNDVKDCPYFEDEVECDSYTCPGSYRCRQSRICVHPQHLYDGIAQCPQGDDEVLYQFRCPSVCTCYRLSIICHLPFETENMTDLRYLDARNSGISPSALVNMTMLVYLSLQNCHIADLDNILFHNLLYLDLSHNDLVSVEWRHLKGASQLKSLNLAWNPIIFVFHTNRSLILPSVRRLDVSHVSMNEMNGNFFQIFPHLHHLNLSSNRISRMWNNFELVSLRVLDLQGNAMEKFPWNALRSLKTLQTMYADNYKLCCPATLPAGLTSFNCHVPSDEISSCKSLLRSDVYRMFLSVFAAFTLLGNLFSFTFRTFMNKTDSTQSYGIFVIHLCVSDFLMGLYLAFIGIADRLYEGTYLWNDVKWRNSVACTVAGFLSLLSNEVSAFNVCLITLDRFLVLHFPFSPMHFGRGSAHMACILAWCSGISLALVPLLPMVSYWQFYSQKSICIPLPITRNDSLGQSYSFGILVCLNFVLFLLIAAGQAFVYWSVCVNSMSAVQSNKKSNDLIIARRLISVAVSDFICWFPIGLLGLLASSDIPVPGEVNVAIALLVMPLNSTINPFLYTLNILLERRRQARDQRLEKFMLNKVNAKVAEATGNKMKLNFSKAEACNLVDLWVESGLISLQDDLIYER